MGLFGRTLGLVKAAVSKALSSYTCSELNNPTTGLTFTQRQLIQAVNSLKSGQTVQYYSNDDGANQYGRGVDFSTLDCSNPFGNTNRFTDTLGGQTYANGLVLDWQTMLMWTTSSVGNLNHSDAIAFSVTYTNSGFSNFFVPNIPQIISIHQYQILNGQGMNYAPFNISSAVFFNTSQSVYSGTTNGYRISNSNGQVVSASKTTANETLLCRFFTLVELGF